MDQGTVEELFPGGGPIWRSYVSFVAWICCGMGIARVVSGISPGLCGVVDAIQSCGAENCSERAAWHALRSLLILIS